MSTAATAEVPASQQARRERILDAAVELATEGGYNAVQMREVADRAGVALGTLYRYFPSKVNLLVAAMGRTLGQLRDSAARGNDDPNLAPGERVYRVVAAVTRFLARNRRLSGAMLRALMSADASAAVDVDAVGATLVSIIASAGGEEGAASPGRDTLVAHVIGKVWLADVLALLSGRMTVAAVLKDLEHTIDLVMR
ncbi:MAG TPA: TetR family transcriptional regulator [Mycobacteriales bacterium]|nr:TetR family transcriptional regulator [Mycobacteriales bacterium]